MRVRGKLDVSGLPEWALGSRDPIFWGVISMLGIEGTMFALLISSYFYLRGNFPQIPPPGEALPPLVAPTLGAIIMLVSLVPNHLMNVAAVKGDLRRMRLWLFVMVAAGALFLVTRFVEFHGLPFTWKSHAYGSAFWALLAMHTLHGIAGTLENLVFAVLTVTGPVEQKHRTDVELNGIYWYFVALSWVLIYAILYLDPGVLHR